MGITIIFASAVVAVPANRLVGGKLLQPILTIAVQAPFIIVGQNNAIA
jgi:hypothetical protein